MHDLINSVPYKIIPLSLGIISLALVSWANWTKTKKSKEHKYDDEEEPINSRSCVVEVKVPSDCVRSIIGQQGANIKKIQQNTNTRISLKKESSDEEPEKTFVIRGSSVNVQQAELEIKKFISDTGRLLTEEYFIPDYAVGRIIGKNGTIIREMSRASNCLIKFSSSGKSKPGKECANIVESMDEMKSSEKKVISFSGNAENISSAKNLIISKIAEEETRRQHKKKLYNNNLKMLKEYSIKHASIENDINRISSSNGAGYRKELHLDFDKTVDVYVSAVADPLQFWVQIIDHLPELNKMNNELNDYLCENPTSLFKNIDEVKIGMLVAGSYENSSWFRVEIQGYKFMNNKKMLDVFYVDYGNCEYLDVKDLRRLPEKFNELPWQAIESSLDNINEENWTEESIVFFEKIVDSCRKKPLELRLVRTLLNSRNYTINLVQLNEKDKNKKNISEMLVNEGYCKYLTNPVTKFESNQVEKEFPTKGW